jgi:uncharacterized protein RhaS with RHS repeats
VYYGYRYYIGVIGRWTNRDPIVERGGINLHNFVRNMPIRVIDLLGKSTAEYPDFLCDTNSDGLVDPLEWHNCNFIGGIGELPSG